MFVAVVTHIRICELRVLLERTNDSFCGLYHHVGFPNMCNCFLLLLVLPLRKGLTQKEEVQVTRLNFDVLFWTYLFVLVLCWFPIVATSLILAHIAFNDEIFREKITSQSVELSCVLATFQIMRRL